MERVIGRIHGHTRSRHRIRRRLRYINTALRVKINLRRQGELTQRFAHRRHQNLEDRLLVGKFDLRFRRMDIDVYRLRRYVKIDEERRLVVGRQHARIGRLHGFQEIRMPHVPAVHKEILLRLACRVLRLHHKTADGHQLRLGIDIHESGRIDIAFGVAEDSLDTLFLRPRRQLHQDLVVMHEFERDLRLNEHDMIELR